MIPAWPAAGGAPPAHAALRVLPEDFKVCEELGFEPSGEGEHVFLHLEKRLLNTSDLVSRVAQLSAVHPRDIGFSGMKDRNAVTRQWLSVRLAGRAEPDWSALETESDIRLLAARRHRRKLKRGVHRGNRFSIRLRQLEGDRGQLEQRLQRVSQQGAPNYFGEQRFGRDGATLAQARAWMDQGGRRVSRHRRGLYFSALRAYLFNALLAQRVAAGTWNSVLPQDVCHLQGSRSQFRCDQVDADIRRRAACGDIHPGLPLWGRAGEGELTAEMRAALQAVEGSADICGFLEGAGLDLAWRPARMLADDFCWQFCDDGSLQLDFALGAGCYATALLTECVRFGDRSGE